MQGHQGDMMGNQCHAPRAWLRGWGIILLLLSMSMLLALSASSATAACSNEAVRLGPSAALPDCRAYELVSPPDTNGRLLEPINSFALGGTPELFPTELASPFRDSVLYMAYAGPLRELAGGTGIFDLYQARRSEGGWATTRRVTLAGEETGRSIPGGSPPEHSYAFVGSEGSFGTFGGAGGPISHLSNPDGTYELTGTGELGNEPFAQGRFISAGGDHIIFTTGDDPALSGNCFVASSCPVLKLEENAPDTGTGAIYDRSADGPTHVVSLLPPNNTPAAGQHAFFKGVSKDGSSVAFTIEGTLYVHVDNGEPGEHTLKVAEGGPAYAGLSDDGRYIFYVVGGNKGVIHRLDTATSLDADINPSAVGEIVNVSADGSHVYFIAEEEIGGEGISGEPNLFVWSGGTPEYVTTVASTDTERTSGAQNGECPSFCGIPALTRWTNYAVAPPQGSIDRGPGADSSRTTPDGEVLIFESKAKLTDYDNTGHTEIYRYDDQDKSLLCVSCSLTGKAAEHDARLQELKLVIPGIVIHNLSADGSRVFFETADALTGADTDGVVDIYEWQKEGESERLDLISSGKSVEIPPLSPELFHAPKSNLLLSVTPEGEDVVFLTQDVLVPGAGEGGAPAIYDARVDGGFPPPSPLLLCAEEDCRGLAGTSPASPSGALSERVAGPGNVKARKSRKHRCHRQKRGKHRGCKRHRKNQHRARISVAAGAISGQPQDAQVNEGAVAPSSSPVAVGSVGGGSASRVTAAAAGVPPFAIETAEATLTTDVAGAHPDFKTTLAFTHYLQGATNRATGKPEEVSVSLPPGLLGSVNAAPRCDTGHLLALANCPLESQVGIVRGEVETLGKFTQPVFNLVPPHPDREVARLGFWGALYPVFIDIEVHTATDYSVTATVHSAPAVLPLMKAETTLWGSPTDPVHDVQRLMSIEQGCPGIICNPPGGKRAVPRTNLAFMTNPSACQAGSVDFAVTNYQLPGQVFSATAPLPEIKDCQGLPFAPRVETEPTSHVAGAPTGLKTKLVLPQHLRADERATATIREARVTLPEGMQVAAGAANWIGTCTDEQVGYRQEVDTACPDNSKLGTAEITSPALSVPIEGAIYQRSPSPGHQLGLWLTADALGLHIKLPGELEPDKTTGRLTAVFRDLPQVPVEEIELNVWGGPRAPLENPDSCGTYTTEFSFSPHSNDPAATGQSTMQIDQGCNQGFNPALKAGVTDPTAGKFSPFVFDLARPDGDQALRGFHLKLPDGELAKLKGVPLCPDDAAAAAGCPQASRIGSLTATSGPGPDPFTIPEPGKPEPQIYLAGPYGGSPFSIVSQVPAQAGPFDLGILAVRSGLEVEPETGRAVVKADPLPQFFEGVGIAYRHLHAVVDRPEFSLNPTDCREMSVTSDVTSTQGTVAHPSARFQVDGCKALKFKPKLSLKLRGGTKRADYPALTAVLKARKGDANIAFASVALPHSEFLAQEHIGTICTRKQFAADKCPKGSVYGKAKAFTPLLEKPLSGPVYLRSSDHPLPDLVAKLGGQLEIHLVGRIDSKNGGIRTTFESVPDAPITRFVLQMKGGRKGLLTNSTDICRGVHKANVAMRAQNGRRLGTWPVLQSSGCAREK